MDGDLINEAKALMYRGDYTLFDPTRISDQVHGLQKAIVIYNRLHLPLSASNCWIIIGYLDVGSLALKSGVQDFKEALRLQDSVGFRYTHYATDDISMATIFQGKYGEPLKYAIRSVRTSEASPDSNARGIFYERLGLLYSMQDNKHEESLKWLWKSIQWNTIHDPNPDVYRPLITLVNMHEDIDSRTFEMVQKTTAQFPPRSVATRLTYNLLMGICYMHVKRFQLAEKYILEALELEKQQEEIRGNYERSAVYSTAGELYFLEGQYARSKIYLEKSLADPEHPSALINILSTHHMLYTIDSAQGDYASAFHHLNTYIELLDSSLNLQMSRQAEELAVQYETEQKEADIKIRDQRIGILQQADLLKQASLNSARSFRNWTIAGTILSLAIAGLLFRLYKQKQATTRIIGQKNELLESLLTEKEWLLKEVHHRVKNNLQTVICLLESQARYLNNEALEAIDDSRRRIYAMSLLHQKIYQTTDLNILDMNLYLREFISYLKESFGTPGHLYFNLDIAPVKLSITQAIPVVLIVNEAVTNSIKHAFTGRSRGEILISLQKKNTRIILIVADNGTGMDPVMADIELNSLGLNLIKGLSRELRGEIIFEKENGTKLTVIFEAVSTIETVTFSETIQQKEYTS